MLTFQITNAGKGIQIHCDEQGMATLINALNDIPSMGHVHLLSAANGGRELAETTPFGGEAIGGVVISWTGE